MFYSKIHSWLQFGSISAVFSSSSLRHPGSWKMVGGVVLMLYMLTMNPCFILVPKIPRLYSFLYVITIFYHFVLVTGVPLFRRKLHLVFWYGIISHALSYYLHSLQWGPSTAGVQEYSTNITGHLLHYIFSTTTVGRH